MVKYYTGVGYKRCGSFFLAGILLIILLFSGCTTPRNIHTGTNEKPDPHLVNVRQLMNQREFRSALFRLEVIINQNEPNASAHYLAGESYFHMAQYGRALEEYKQTIEINPSHLDARHRHWAASLQRSKNTPELKLKVYEKVYSLEKLFADDPENLLIAYYGYSYIWDQASQQRIILRLTELSVPHSLKSRVASILLYEILRNKSQSLRQKLVVAFLEKYAGYPGSDIAASVLFHSIPANKARQAEVMSWVNHFTSPPAKDLYINYYAARSLIDHKINIPKAIKLLRYNLGELLQKNIINQKIAAQLSRHRVLLGIAYYKQNKFRRAKRWLAQGLDPEHPDSTAHYYLANIARKAKQDTLARTHFIKAMEINSHWSQAEIALAELISVDNKTNKTVPQLLARKNNIVHFTDATQTSGLSGVSGQRVAWGDYDNDGDEDLLVDGVRLFSNDGHGNFINVSEDTGIPKIEQATGGIWGDYNKDGRLDIFVTTKKHNRILQQGPDGRFHDVSRYALPDMEAANSEAAAWGDMDNDGDIDLYIANYQQHAVERGICSQDRLLRNRGDRFVDASAELGIHTIEAMCGRGVTWGDYDNDKRSDILVANYRLDPNYLWHNLDTEFRDAGKRHGVAGREVNSAYGHSIGPVFADFNNDGRLDIFIANLAHPRNSAFSDKSMMFLSRGPGSSGFRRLLSPPGIRFEETYSDAAAADVDNDGDIDLFITAIYSSGESHLYLNDGKGNFKDVSWLSGTRLRNTWGSAFADIDNDGDMDLVVASQNGIHLLKNDGTPHSWLKIRIQSEQCTRNGIGARISVQYGNKQQIREVTAGRGTGNQDALTQHFGLGNTKGPVTVRVVDSCGKIITKKIQVLNQTVTFPDGT